MELKDLVVASDLELGHVIAVALDDRPLSVSERILLQVMSEEQESGRQVELVNATVKRIVKLGGDPWQVRRLTGTLRLKRVDAARLTVTALDLNGHPAGSAGTGERIDLQPATLYYLISR